MGPLGPGGEVRSSDIEPLVTNLLRHLGLKSRTEKVPSRELETAKVWLESIFRPVMRSL